MPETFMDITYMNYTQEYTQHITEHKKVEH